MTDDSLIDEASLLLEELWYEVPGLLKQRIVELLENIYREHPSLRPSDSVMRRRND